MFSACVLLFVLRVWALCVLLKCDRRDRANGRGLCVFRVYDLCTYMYLEVKRMARELKAF